MRKATMYGIHGSNLSQDALWSRELFPRAFSVALMNYMRDAGIDANLIRTKGQGAEVVPIRLSDVYGTDSPSSELRFCFDMTDERRIPMAEGLPQSDLVIRDASDSILSSYDMAVSVVPDASTRGLSRELTGPEVTVRFQTLANCALGMASSLMDVSEEALGILGEPLDLGDWRYVSERRDDVVSSLAMLENRFSDRQSPFLIQAVWRSEEDGPFMAEDAMDVFVWSDFALTRLFLDSGRSSSGDVPTRPERCAVRLHGLLTRILSGERVDIPSFRDLTSYGIPGVREFMVNGRATVRYMGCPRLSSPAVSSAEMPYLASEGFECALAPERRLDTSVYYAVRALRG